nr:hypothetical protein GCM10011355_12790 [Aquisalinus luteolus]
MGRAISVMAIFILVGPLIGALTMSFGLGAVGAWSYVLEKNYMEAARLLLGGWAVVALFAVPIGYIVGLPSAAMTGIVVAFRTFRTGRPSIIMALIAGLVLGVFNVLATGENVQTGQGVAFWMGALICAHLLAALVCGAIAKAMIRPV